MTTTPPIISVSIVDDHTLFREGLTNLLSEYADLKVLFSANNGIDLQQKLIVHPCPDVVLMDINMPQMDGHQTTCWLKANYHQVHVLALSMYEDDLSIIRMIRGGAGGYILKESNTAEVVRGIRSVVQHHYFINDLVSGKLFYSLRENGAPATMKITEREREFLKLCCSELTYKEIAARMGVSPRTVENYREDLFRKLETRYRVGLVLYALKQGIVDLRELQ